MLGVYACLSAASLQWTFGELQFLALLTLIILHHNLQLGKTISFSQHHIGKQCAQNVNFC